MLVEIGTRLWNINFADPRHSYLWVAHELGRLARNGEGAVQLSATSRATANTAGRRRSGVRTDDCPDDIVVLDAVGKDDARPVTPCNKDSIPWRACIP